MNKPKLAKTFQPMTTLTEKVVAIPGANTDTDQIIPGRFLKKNRALGYDQFLFHDMRFDDEGNQKPHPLNAPESERPQILVVDGNFGCGSSREGAVYALTDYGVRVVIGTTFGDIFLNNCFKNGVLPIRLSDADHDRLMQWVQQGEDSKEMTVDLIDCNIQWADDRAEFSVDAFWRECLTQGLDELSLTQTYGEQIETFESQYRQNFPWLLRQTV